MGEIVVNIAVSNPPPWVKISGKITGAGSPAAIPGTQIRLFAPATRLAATASLQSDGSFHIDKVFPGTYNAEFVPQPEGINAIVLTVPERDLNGIEIPLPARHAVKGRVSAGTTASMPSMLLTMSGLESTTAEPAAVAVLPVNRQLPVAQDGQFSTVLPDGEYRVDIGRIPFPYAIQSATQGAVDLSKDTLKVRDRDVDNVAVVLTIPEVAVSGHVALPRNRNGADALRVTLSGPGLRETLKATLDPNDATGGFRFDRVPYGQYTIQLEPSGATFQVRVDREDISNLDIVMLQGRVRGASSATLSATKIWASTASDPFGLFLTVREDGGFEMMLLKGEYRIQLSPPAGFRVTSFTAGTIDLTNSPLPVPGDEKNLQAVLEPTQ